MELPQKVTLVEVGPRDGLQNEKETIPTSIKIEFINKLSEAGLPVIEASSFVSAEWVPQLADAKEVMQGIKQSNNTRYSALVPNLKGFEHALAVNVKEIAVFTAASETFSQKNTNCSIEESLSRLQIVIEKAQKGNIPVRAYISCVLGCPYEGDVAIEKVSMLTRALLAMGCYQVSLGDTIGIGTANKVKELLTHVTKKTSIEKLAVHFHDTYGQALCNIYSALQCGINTVDASVGGLGGCPYAPGAGGNVATEDVLFLLNGLGIETGVNMDALLSAGHFIANALKRPVKSKVGQALISESEA